MERKNWDSQSSRGSASRFFWTTHMWFDPGLKGQWSGQGPSHKHRDAKSGHLGRCLELVDSHADGRIPRPQKLVTRTLIRFDTGCGCPLDILFGLALTLDAGPVGNQSGSFDRNGVGRLASVDAVTIMGGKLQVVMLPWPAQPFPLRYHCSGHGPFPALARFELQCRRAHRCPT